MPSLEDGFTLALVLTAAGATAGAAIITGLIELLKRVAPIVGRYATGLAFVFSAILVIAAYASVTTIGGGTEAVSPESVFAAFLAWYGIATIATGTYDNVGKAQSARSGG